MSKTVYTLFISLLILIVKCLRVASDDLMFSPRPTFGAEIIQSPSKNHIGREQETKEINLDLIRKSRRKMINFSDLINVTIEFSKISALQSHNVSPLFNFVTFLECKIYQYYFF